MLTLDSGQEDAAELRRLETRVEMLLIKERDWLRPKERIRPKSPSEGIRATIPNEYWHIDVTVIRLLNGARVDL